MEQNDAPMLEALDIVERRPITGFGGPGHNRGHGLDEEVRRLLGARAFEADVLTPKGLDDRRESARVMERATKLAAEAWGGDQCLFATGGSTQALQVALAAVVPPGAAVLIAANAHRAEFSMATVAGLDIRVLPAAVDAAIEIEHGVDPAALEAALDANPDARAVVVASPTVYGVTSDIAALAAVCHARSVPLIADSAWGAAHAFCDELPVSAIEAGADIMTASVHKTMGALAQGAIVVARGTLVDPGRLALAHSNIRTTSPSVPVLASIDAARRLHARQGGDIWRAVIARAQEARRRLAAIPGITVRGREMLGAPGAHDLDETKILLAVSALGITGHQADEWLQAERRVSLVVADFDHVLAVVSSGTEDADVDALVDGVAALAAAAAKGGDERLGRRGPAAPSLAALRVEMAMGAAAAFFAPYEVVKLADAVGRIAAEAVTISPPEIPRLLPGQRIGRTQVEYLLASLAAGAVIPDPTRHGVDHVRVVRQ